MQCRALCTQAAEICRMSRVAGNSSDPRAIALDQHTAAYAAITTGGLRLSHAGSVSNSHAKPNFMKIQSVEYFWQ